MIWTLTMCLIPGDRQLSDLTEKTYADYWWCISDYPSYNNQLAVWQFQNLKEKSSLKLLLSQTTTYSKHQKILQFSSTWGRPSKHLKSAKSLIAPPPSGQLYSVYYNCRVSRGYNRAKPTTYQLLWLSAVPCYQLLFMVCHLNFINTIGVP